MYRPNGSGGTGGEREGVERGSWRGVKKAGGGERVSFNNQTH